MYLINKDEAEHTGQVRSEMMIRYYHKKDNFIMHNSYTQSATNMIHRFIKKTWTVLKQCHLNGWTFNMQFKYRNLKFRPKYYFWVLVKDVFSKQSHCIPNGSKQVIIAWNLSVVDVLEMFAQYLWMMYLQALFL